MRQITVIGTGYVGLTTGATLAGLGHDVTRLDVDAAGFEYVGVGRGYALRGKAGQSKPVQGPWLPQRGWSGMAQKMYQTQDGRPAEAAP